jgi:hypothetical protein
MWIAAASKGDEGKQITKAAPNTDWCVIF